MSEIIGRATMAVSSLLEQKHLELVLDVEEELPALALNAIQVRPRSGRAARLQEFQRGRPTRRIVRRGVVAQSSLGQSFEIPQARIEGLPFDGAIQGRLGRWQIAFPKRIDGGAEQVMRIGHAR